jgi:hydrophobe/amphiphile efflux-1 (HAE1) family protein
MATFFIRRPVFAIVISLVILIAGGLSIFALPIAQYPQITPPTIEVEINYPGANAETVEQSIASVVEAEVNGAENMIYYSSKSTSDGRYVLTCTFKVGANLDMANVEINNRISKAQAKLPSEAVSYGISVKKKSPDMLAVICLHSPDGTYDDLFLSNYATLNVVDPLARTPGVGSTMIVGQRDYSMRLWLRPDVLAKLNLTAGDLANVVKEQNILAPAGAVGQLPAKPGREFQYTLNVKGRLETRDEFQDMVVRTLPDGSILRVRDVARSEMGARSYTSYGRLNGRPATVIVAYQLPGGNAIETMNLIQNLVEEKRKELPPGLACDISLDTTLFVHAAIDEVVHTLRDAVILVLVVVFVFLGNFRATLIPMLAVPVSLVGTFAAFVALDFSINTLTLFGIVLAVGIVVDDAIVVVEAVEHHIEHGLDPVKATEQAMKEVSGPVIAIALVLCAVFVPVAFMGGITGQLYRQFAMTLSISVLLSALVALTLTPALCAMMLKKRQPMKGPVGAFLRGFNKLFDKTTAGYTRIVKGLVRGWMAGLLILGGAYFLVVTLMGALPTGFVPEEDQGYCFVSFALPDGASLERTEALTARAEQATLKIPGVRDVVTFGGLSILTNAFTPNNATLVVLFEPWADRKASEEKVQGILAKLKSEFAPYPEAVAIPFVPPSIPGLGSAGGFQFELQDRAGRSATELAQTTRDFLDSAGKKPEVTSLFTGFRTTVPQLQVDVDREKARTLGVPVNDVFQSMQIFLGGLQVNDFNLFGRVWKVLVQAEADYRATPENIRDIWVRTGSGRMVPMTTLATVKPVAGPDLIQRYNQYRCAEINGQSPPGVSSGQSIAAMEAAAAEGLPQGYGFEWTGTAYQEKEAGGQQAMIFVLGLVFVFLFLSAQYESWAIPFSVILGIPLCVLGALFAVWVAGIDNNTYVQIGIVMLIGLAAKNAILIVEFAKMKREEGVELREAAVEGAKLRFRPILMTSFAFILGVVPLLLASGAGAASRVALGTAVFGGMTCATVFGVFLIPVLYVVVQWFAEKWGGPPKPKAAPAAAAPGHAPPHGGEAHP